jgi:DNA-binding transcriptional MerR regulator
MASARSYSLSELVEATGFDRRTIVYYIQSGLLPKVGRRGPHTRYPSECLTRLMFIRGVRSLQTQGLLLTATLAEIRRALLARKTAAIQDLLDRGLPGDEVTALFAASSESEQSTPLQLAPPELIQPPPATPAPEPVRPPAGERRSYGLADAGIRKRFGVEKPPAPIPPEIHHEETHPGLPVLDPAMFQQATFQPSIPTGGPAAGAEATAVDLELGELLRELEVRPTLNARRSPPGAPEQWTEIPITSRVYLSVRGLAEDDVPLAEAVARLLKRALRSRPVPPSQ